MNEKIELQGYSLKEFEKLMNKLHNYSPNWADYIRKNKNKTTLDMDELFTARCDMDLSEDPEVIWEGINGELYLPAIFTTKDNEFFDLSNSQCCVVGEAYCCSGRYVWDGSEESSEACSTCEEFSSSVIEHNLFKDKNLGILDLFKTQQFVEHMEEEHND